MDVMIVIIILSFDIAPFPFKPAQRRITIHCQRIDVWNDRTDRNLTDILFNY